MACFGNLLSSIRKACHNHWSLLSLMVRLNVCSVVFFPTFPFRTLSLHGMPSIRRWNLWCASSKFYFCVTDLRPISGRNRMIKFADDTYLIVPEECTTTSEDELQYIQNWAQGCNLSLDGTKTKEIIFQAKGRRRNSTQLPAVCPGIDMVEQLTALGVSIIPLVDVSPRFSENEVV